jgi:hypothetical protein
MSPLAYEVELSFLGALKHCANGVIVFPILGHLIVLFDWMIVIACHAID